MLEQVRQRPISIEVWTDNEAARLAAKRGHSGALAHLSKHAGLSLSFLKESGAKFVKVGTKDNLADLLTKPLDAQTLDCLWKICCRPALPSKPDTDSENN